MANKEGKKRSGCRTVLIILLILVLVLAAAVFIWFKTHADEISKALHDKVVDYSHRLTRHISIAAQIAMLLKDIPDEGLRNRIHDLLKELK